MQIRIKKHPSANDQSRLTVNFECIDIDDVRSLWTGKPPTVDIGVRNYHSWKWSGNKWGYYREHVRAPITDLQSGVSTYSFYVIGNHYSKSSWEKWMNAHILRVQNEVQQHIEKRLAWLEARSKSPGPLEVIETKEADEPPLVEDSTGSSKFGFAPNLQLDEVALGLVENAMCIGCGKSWIHHWGWACR